jgi:hypothetical protein
MAGTEARPTVKSYFGKAAEPGRHEQIDDFFYFRNLLIVLSF